MRQAINLSVCLYVSQENKTRLGSQWTDVSRFFSCTLTLRFVKKSPKGPLADVESIHTGHMGPSKHECLDGECEIFVIDVVVVVVAALKDLCQFHVNVA